MNGTDLIRAVDCPQVAWKNGGGTTREIACFPVGAGMDTFAWRLSAARVDAPGAFSHFAGVDRTIAILSGHLRLDVAGRVPISLAPGNAAYAFAGDSAAFGTPIDGRVLDLNLMVRRQSGTGSMRAMLAGPIAAVAATTILVATRSMTLDVAGRTVTMAPHDAIRLGCDPARAVVASAPMWMVAIVLAETT